MSAVPAALATLPTALAPDEHSPVVSAVMSFLGYMSLGDPALCARLGNLIAPVLQRFLSAEEPNLQVRRALKH